MPEPSPPTHRVPGWAVGLLKGALVVGALYLTWRLISGIRWSDLATRMETASWPLLAAALAVLLARYAVWDWRFRRAAARVLDHPPGPVVGFFVLMASAALNLITPSARLIGGIMRARYFAKSAERSFALLYGVVLYDQVAHHAVMAFLTWVAVVVTALLLGYRGFGFLALAALVAAVVFLVVWSRRGGSFEENPIVRFLARRAAADEGRLRKLYAQGHEAVGTFVKLLADAPLRRQAAAIGVLYFFVNALGQWLVFLAMGEEVNPLLVIGVVAIGGAAGMLTGTPGGLGTTEAAMVALFVALGVGRVEASAGTLLFRGLHYAGVLAVGLPALAALELRAGRAKEAVE